MTENQHDINSAENIARRQHGQSVLSRINGNQGEAVIDSLANISPALGHHVAAFAFGDIYDRTGLSARSRQFATLGILTALGVCEPQLKVHVSAALSVGMPREEITEKLLHAAVYCDFPKALNATFVAKEVFAERDGAEN